MNSTTIISIFNSNNSNFPEIKTQYRQTNATITDRILKFKSMIKKQDSGKQYVIYCYYFQQHQFLDDDDDDELLLWYG